MTDNHTQGNVLDCTRKGNLDPEWWFTDNHEAIDAAMTPSGGYELEHKWACKILDQYKEMECFVGYDYFLNYSLAHMHCTFYGHALPETWELANIGRIARSALPTQKHHEFCDKIVIPMLEFVFRNSNDWHE